MLLQLKSFLEKINNRKDRLLFPFIKRFWPRFILPNHLTISRMVLAVFLIILLFAGYKNRVWLALIFVIASLLDLFDGLVARALNKESRLGAFLDTAADIALVLPIMIFVLFKNNFWLLALLLLAEIIYGLGYLYNKARHRRVGTNIFGKTKMVIECVALSVIILFDFPNAPSQFPVILLYMAIILEFLNSVLNILISSPKNAQSL